MHPAQSKRVKRQLYLKSFSEYIFTELLTENENVLEQCLLRCEVIDLLNQIIFHNIQRVLRGQQLRVFVN